MRNPTPHESEAYSFGLQPSASRSDILIECSFPFGKDLEHSEASEAARYGSSFHEILAEELKDGITPGIIKTRGLAWRKQVAKRWGVEDKINELMEHVPAARIELLRWLSRNEFRIDFDKVRKSGLMLLEKAIALKPLRSGRNLPPHDEAHRYHDLEEGELAGTLDLAIVPNPKSRKTVPVLVIDHKTGEEDFSRPLDKPQLLTLAAATMRMTGAPSAIVGVLHARRRGMPKVYADHVKLSELRKYETRLEKGLDRIGDGSMHPGAWCKWCPARPVCPAQDAELLAKAGDVLTGLTAAGGALSREGLTANDVALARVTPGTLSKERKLGLLYEVVRKAEALAGRARTEIKNAILESGGGLLPETPSGEYLVIREYEKESLSKDSVMKAYGKTAGERMLTKFRVDGAIRTSKVVQLYPEKERGR